MNKIVLLFMIFLLASSIASNPTYAWLTGWKYRIQQNITNMDNNAITGMTVNITLDTQSLITAGKMDSDCRFRVTNATDYVITDYAIDVCDDSTSNITFKSDYAAGETKSFYIYYKNAGASLTNQSWDSVYWSIAENCTSIDLTTKWNATNVSSGDYVFAEDGFCVFNKTSSGAYWSNGIVYRIPLSLGSLDIIIRANYSGSNNDAVFFAQLTNQTNFGWDRYGLSIVSYGWHDTYSPNERTGIQNNTHWIFYEGSPPFANLNVFEMRMNTTHYKYIINDSLRSSGFWIAKDLNSTPSFWVSRSGYYGGMAWMDYVYVRQVSMEEPAIASGSEEESLFPMVVNANTSIPQNTYYVNDTDGTGIIQINASNVTFDCNNSLFIGNNTGIFINILTGVNGLNIINCGITNYTYSVYGGYYDTAGEIGARVSHFTNNTLRNARYAMFMGGVSTFDFNHIYDTTVDGFWSGLFGSWDSYNRDNLTVSYNYLDNSNLYLNCPRSFLGAPYWQDYVGCIVNNNEIYNSASSAITLGRKGWGYGYSPIMMMNNNIMKNNSGCGLYVSPIGYSWSSNVYASNNNTITNNGCGIGTENYGNPMTWYGLYNSTITGNSGIDVSLYRGTLHLVNVTTSDIYAYGAAAVYRDWYGYALNVYGWNGTIAGANVYLYGAAWNDSLGSTDSQGNTTYTGVLTQYYVNATGRYNSSVSASKSGWKPNSMDASMVANNVHESMKMKMYADPELYLNGADDDVYITFATTLNVTALLNGGLGSQSGFILMLNGTPISSPDIGKHSAGLYNYTSTFSENADFASLIGSVTHYAWIDICSSGTCRVIREVGGGISGLFTAITNPLAYIMLILGIVAGVLVIFYGVVTVISRIHS